MTPWVGWEPCRAPVLPQQSLLLLQATLKNLRLRTQIRLLQVAAIDFFATVTTSHLSLGFRLRSADLLGSTKHQSHWVAGNVGTAEEGR